MSDTAVGPEKKQEILGMRKNGEDGNIVVFSSGLIQTVYREAMACTAKGLPPRLRLNFVRTTEQAAHGNSCDEGKGEGDEGRKGGRKTGTTDIARISMRQVQFS